MSSHYDVIQKGYISSKLRLRNILLTAPLSELTQEVIMFMYE